MWDSLKEDARISLCLGWDEPVQSADIIMSACVGMGADAILAACVDMGADAILVACVGMGAEASLAASVGMGADAILAACTGYGCRCYHGGLCRVQTLSWQSVLGMNNSCHLPLPSRHSCPLCAPTPRVTRKQVSPASCQCVGKKVLQSLWLGRKCACGGFQKGDHFASFLSQGTSISNMRR